jgi:hypothetical protein
LPDDGQSGGLRGAGPARICPPNPIFDGLLRWLARPRKRHYTFARRPDRSTAGDSARRHRKLQRVDLPGLFVARNGVAGTGSVTARRHFRSLRLSVRTPPFHGGESGSIPLGSASDQRRFGPSQIRRNWRIRAAWSRLKETAPARGATEAVVSGTVPGAARHDCKTRRIANRSR